MMIRRFVRARWGFLLVAAVGVAWLVAAILGV